MSKENISNFLERNKLEQLLHELSHSLVTIDKKDLSDEDVETLCQKGYAVRIQNKKLASFQYLQNCIFKSIKNDNPKREINDIDGHYISPEYVNIVLNRLMNDGLVVKDGHRFKPNLENIFSEEAIKQYVKHRIDSVTLNEIVSYFEFKPTTKDRFEYEIETEASIQCQKILKKLVTDGFLIQHQHKKDTYFVKMQKAGD